MLTVRLAQSRKFKKSGRLPAVRCVPAMAKPKHQCLQDFVRCFWLNAWHFLAYRVESRSRQPDSAPDAASNIFQSRARHSWVQYAHFLIS